MKTLDYRINEFIVFCIEIYKEKYNMSGEETYDLFSKYGVLDYLNEGFDVLHTEGEGWLMDDIKTYLENRGYKQGN